MLFKFLLVKLVEKSMQFVEETDEEGGQEVTQVPSYNKYPELQVVQT